MVFEAGGMVEFDAPPKLLSNPAGYLTHLVHETNSVNLAHMQAHAAVLTHNHTSHAEADAPAPSSSIGMDDASDAQVAHENAVLLSEESHAAVLEKRAEQEAES